MTDPYFLETLVVGDLDAIGPDLEQLNLGEPLVLARVADPVRLTGGGLRLYGPTSSAGCPESLPHGRGRIALRS